MIEGGNWEVGKDGEGAVVERRGGEWDGGGEIRVDGERAKVKGKGSKEEIREDEEGTVVEGRGGGWDVSGEIREDWWGAELVEERGDGWDGRRDIRGDRKGAGGMRWGG